MTNNLYFQGSTPAVGHPGTLCWRRNMSSSPSSPALSASSSAASSSPSTSSWGTPHPPSTTSRPSPHTYRASRWVINAGYSEPSLLFRGYSGGYWDGYRADDPAGITVGCNNTKMLMRSYCLILISKSQHSFAQHSLTRTGTTFFMFHRKKFEKS